MAYSAIGFLAVAILLIVNQDVLFRSGDGHEIPAFNAYRRFLFAVLAYYITDLLWGVFDAVRFRTGILVDTIIYFLVMGLAILFWTQYVAGYLGSKNKFRWILLSAGWFYLGLVIVALVVNFIWPILFWFDAEGVYHTGFARHVTLALQIVMFFLTSSYALYIAANRSEKKVVRRHRAIGIFGLAMMLFILVQIRYPLLPLYSVGYMIGTCLLHSFVIEDEKEEYRRGLEASALREKEQKIELGIARELAYTDALTGVKSKHAYAEYEEQIDRKIAEGSITEFAIAVFDVNDLKQINDTRGHETGDRYIVKASRMICNQFKHSPVFRIGGDEFVAILETRDYKDREALEKEFNEMIDKNFDERDVVVSLGMSDYIPLHDNSFRRAFERADRQMYNRKTELKNRAQEISDIS